MAKSKYAPGQKFGKLTLLEFDSYRNGKGHWKCLCDCGNETIANISNVSRGKMVSCGCQRRSSVAERNKAATGVKKKTYYRGMKFGMLTTLAKCRVTDGKYPGWLCRCDCGNEVKLRSSNLIRGHVKSCGCQRYIKNSYQDPQKASWNKFKSTYTQGAKTRNLSWELEDETFKKLTTSDCHFCGVPPNKLFTAYEIKSGRRFYGVSEQRIQQSKLLVGGIDRLDNESGYTEENTVPCCSICNYAKRDLTLDEFESWLDRMIEFRTKKGG